MEKQPKEILNLIQQLLSVQDLKSCIRSSKLFTNFKATLLQKCFIKESRAKNFPTHLIQNIRTHWTLSVPKKYLNLKVVKITQLAGFNLSRIPPSVHELIIETKSYAYNFKLKREPINKISQSIKKVTILSTIHHHQITPLLNPGLEILEINIGKLPSMHPHDDDCDTFDMLIRRLTNLPKVVYLKNLFLFSKCEVPHLISNHLTHILISNCKTGFNFSECESIDHLEIWDSTTFFDFPKRIGKLTIINSKIIGNYGLDHIKIDHISIKGSKIQDTFFLQHPDIPARKLGIFKKGKLIKPGS